MKIIKHSYGADLSWIENFANQFGGKIEDNYIIIPEELQTGTRYFLDCGEGIVAYYINVKYNKNFRFIQKNEDNDFVGLYYNLTEGEATVSRESTVYDVGRWRYNLSVLDGSLETDYNVKAGSSTFALYIFIKKEKIISFVKDHNITFRDIDLLTDPNRNTIVRFDRMSSESYHLLNDLRKLEVGGSIFNLNLIGTVQMLISNYLKKMASRRIIIQTVNSSDLSNIIASQMYLIDHIGDHFPSITQMANRANMSETKFKNLFKKITGSTANKFFMDNKLLKAKELLESKQLSISQVSDQLSFTNNSYFASKFKENFGLSPKTFIKQL
ncbi:AraC family transcriptional regulator [Flavobacterium sp. KBS0721]|uniref:helix-turn-helix domain-containing protein n=1 Tax=Flavobacterium sp. KBS0721 TaxID=1179672 RepID=UPI00098F6279|nr:AraC family transcriptional regulator [Flavobacterium sp. KBS0721]QDW22418.1 helix-turn-helix transcriptional regulator [Flavobacterium sp. KBS0721]